MIQVGCLILLIVCKLSPAAPGFPFIIIGMVFLRRFIERYFTEDELEDVSCKVYSFVDRIPLIRNLNYYPKTFVILLYSFVFFFVFF